MAERHGPTSGWGRGQPAQNRHGTASPQPSLARPAQRVLTALPIRTGAREHETAACCWLQEGHISAAAGPARVQFFTHRCTPALGQEGRRVPAPVGSVTRLGPSFWAQDNARAHARTGRLSSSAQGTAKPHEAPAAGLSTGSVTGCTALSPAGAVVPTPAPFSTQLLLPRAAAAAQTRLPCGAGGAQQDEPGATTGPFLDGLPPPGEGLDTSFWHLA